MQLESEKLLYDILDAAKKIARFCHEKSFTDYLADDLLRSGVERQFEIIGEALAQLAKRDPATVEKISDYRRIIAFRNILIHAYAKVDDHVVWGLVESKVAVLSGEAEKLLEMPG